MAKSFPNPTPPPRTYCGTSSVLSDKRLEIGRSAPRYSMASA